MEWNFGSLIDNFSKNVGLIEECLIQVSDPNISDSSNKNILHHLALNPLKFFNEKLITLFIEKSANPNQLDVKTNFFWIIKLIFYK